MVIRPEQHEMEMALENGAGETEQQRREFDAQVKDLSKLGLETLLAMYNAEKTGTKGH